MDAVLPTVRLRLVVRFREFPFGTVGDPSLCEFVSERPWQDQENVLSYLRSGYVFAIPIGGGARDHIDPSQRANPVVDGRGLAGCTEMTDGEWFWYAALIHYVERYNLRLPEEFVECARRHGWRVHKDGLPPARYEWSYFE
jgi:hypothetical protein